MCPSSSCGGLRARTRAAPGGNPGACFVVQQDERRDMTFQLHLRKPALLRRLVGAPANEPRPMAKASGGIVIISDLHDKGRPERLPFRTALGAPATRSAGC